MSDSNPDQNKPSQASSNQQSTTGQPRPAKRRSRRRRSKSRSATAGSSTVTVPAVPVAASEIIAAFVACGRCSFFLSGYRALRGNDGFVADALQAQDNWLEMAWQPALIPLIEKSYGMSFRDGMYHVEHMCHECGRVFVYRHEPDDDADSQTTLRVQIMPGD